MSQRAAGGASVLMAFLQACDSDTLYPAWRRADLQTGSNQLLLDSHWGSS